MRKQLAAGNWKMNLTLPQAKDLVHGILRESIRLSPEQYTLFAVPFPYLTEVRACLGDAERYLVAAQNCSDKKSGAFTGEVSAEMLASLQVPYCIVGHSERREYFSETNAMLARKLDQCLAHGITPIFCCGEPLTIREGGSARSYVETQLKESIFHLGGSQIKNLVIAYEPIWAIGTGKTATSQQAQEMHAHIRSALVTQYDKATADSVSILYGGSVKASNAKELFSCPDVDGGLVGGASLLLDEFIQIIRSLRS